MDEFLFQFCWLEAEVALLISTLGVINETKRIQADASYILFVTSMNNGMTQWILA